MKKIFAVLIAFAIVFSMTVPAMAAESYGNMGITYAEMKKYEEAIPYLEQALTILMPDHSFYKTVKDCLAYCKQKLSRSAWMSQIQ